MAVAENGNDEGRRGGGGGVENLGLIQEFVHEEVEAAMVIYFAIRLKRWSGVVSREYCVVLCFGRSVEREREGSCECLRSMRERGGVGINREGIVGKKVHVLVHGKGMTINERW